MNVVIVHDATLLPVDHYHALADAGHVVASHGAVVDALAAFLAALKWEPDAFLVDFRGAGATALEAARWLAGNPAAAGKPMVLAHVPVDMAAEAVEAAPGARVVEAPAEAVRALAGA